MSAFSTPFAPFSAQNVEMDLTKLSDDQLLELLVAQIKMYSSHITDWQFNTEEYKECREMLKSLNEEIARRHTQEPAN